MTLTDWANRWGLPPQALVELAGVPAFTPVLPSRPVTTESAQQAMIRLEAARVGKHLWRNNLGAGTPVDAKRLCARCAPLARSFLRWGLANESTQVNAVVKSADLIGIEKVLIRPEHVGTIIGRFVSRECKRPGWKYTGTPEEAAQLRWAAMINANGGNAAIVNSEGSL